MKPDVVLADAEEKANTLHVFGQEETARWLRELVRSLRDGLREYLTWHDEPGAMLLSGRPRGYFRARRREWASRGLAERRGRGWYYREVVIPRKADTQSAAQEAAADAMKDFAA